jgi:AcrR family transcriptional regulator
MASQKSSALAVAPKRQRGRDRVAAIIEAGAAVFAEKGFEAATMTEIAARAGAAIGSLYRFFPTKEALADALLAHYGASLVGAFADIEAGAGEGAPAALAGVLIAVMHSLEPARAAALALIDARPDAAAMRASLRAAIRARLAAILVKAAPTLAPEEARVGAALLLHVLKALRTLPGEGPAASPALIGQARILLARYLDGLGRAPPVGA